MTQQSTQDKKYTELVCSGEPVRSYKFRREPARLPGPGLTANKFAAMA